jgi:type I restriction enzyme, S subunit
MEVKKGYKQTEVGVIPGDWEVTPLGQISDVIMGQSPLGNTYNKAGEGIALINGPTEFTDIYPVKVQWTTHPTKICKKKDLLICVRGSSTGRMNVSDDEYCIGRGVAAIRAKSLSNTVYLTNQIHLGIERLLSLSAGSTFPNVDGKSIRSILIPLPPTKAEQTAIATALSDADALIQSLEKLIAKKRQIKQGAMQKLLKPKKDWMVKRLGEIFTFHGGYTASREQLSVDGYCYLHYGDIHGATKTFINVKSDYAKIPKLQIPLKKVSPKSLLNEGDIVFVDASEDDEGTSRHIVVKNPDGVPYISGLHTIVAKSKDDSVNNDYKRYCFQGAYIKSQFKFYAVGTKVSGISKTNILKIKISLPKLDEQTRIATILADMDAEISALESKLAKYKHVKQGMMQNLLAGKIRLV